MPQPLRILIVEDNPGDAELVVLELRRAGFEPEWRRVDTEADYASHLHGEWDLILSDYQLPDFDGFRALQLLQQRGLEVPFIIVSGAIGEETAVAAMRRGAADYLLKDRLARLGPSVSHALEKARLHRERKRTEASLQLANERYRALAARLEVIREEERTRIAREIHDVLAQDLTRLKIDLIWMAKRLGKPFVEPDRADLAARIADATAQTDTAITTVQRIATELRPVVLDSLGLPAAVEWQAEDFARRTGLRCTAASPRSACALSRNRATAVFRILQESLTNIARHAEATAVDVRLTATAGFVTLKVSDNGHGISSAQISDPRSIGLLGMRERAEASGGVLEIEGRPEGGTTVTVRMAIDGAGAPILP